MHLKLVISATAIALISGLGSASAEEPFAYLEGVRAVQMAPDQLASIRGEGANTFALFNANTLNADALSGNNAGRGLGHPTANAGTPAALPQSVINLNPSP